MTPSLLFLFWIILQGCGAETNRKHVTNPGSIHVGVNIPIHSVFENKPLVEPHISTHPINNDHLLVAAMVVMDSSKPYESCRLSSFVSTDAGKSWKETTHDWWGYDPWTAILSNGHTVMSWIGTSHSFQDKYPIVFFTSPDGGVSWNAEVQQLDGGHDGTKLTPFGSDVFFTTVRFRDDMGADVRLSVSRRGGKFHEVTMVDGDGERLNFCEVAVLTDGTIVIPVSRWKGEAWIHLTKGDGAVLSGPYRITKRLGSKGYARLVSDSSTSTFRDRLYFIRAAGYGNDFEGVWLNYSDDYGRTWSDDIRVDGFASVRSSRANVPSIAVNREGMVGVSWVDCQDDPDGNRNDVYFTVSADGGRTFQPPVRVTTVSSDPRTATNNDVANKFPGGGHYLGMTAKLDGSFQLVWSDSRTGIFQLQTCNVRFEK